MSCDRDKRNSDGTKAFRVGVTVQSLENSYWAGVFGDIETIMDEKGWQYTVLSCNDNANTQIQQIENFITNDVDLIMVHPSDKHALEDYLKIARSKGIKVMCWDDEMENVDVNWILDNEKLGKLIGTTAGSFINHHYDATHPAEVALIDYPQTPILVDREKGIIEGLQESASGNYTIVAQQPGLDAAKSLSQMESILQAHPQVKVVCSIGSGGDIGANEAFMTETKGIIPSDMGIFSADATEQQLTAIVKGEASRASVGMEGSNIKTAEACVALFEKLLNNETFSSKNVYRPLTVMDISNAAQYLKDFAADKQ